MKTAPKTKNTATKKARPAAKKTSKSIVTVGVQHPAVRSLRLVAHRHTGKLIHHRHTSHFALILILLVVGVFLAISTSLAQAGPPQTASGTVSVGVIVPGPPPTVGATILSPVDGTVFVDQDTIEVSGSCAADSFVIIYTSSTIVGSTMCTSAGIFVLTVQLDIGQHILTAKNYDNLNQPGPDTAPVTVTMTQSNVTTSPVVQPLLPTLPINPSIIPGLVGSDNSNLNCARYSGVIPTSSTLHIAVVCLPRLLEPNVEYTLGILIWGGSSPYALDIDWGDKSENTLISLPTAGYKTFTFKYSGSGVYTISFKLKDKDGRAAYVQTAVRVNGQTETVFSGITDAILRTSWFETPVPIYFLAVAITLGFWAGDLFDRRFGISKHRRSGKAA